jgi:hypothetical protein
LAWASLEITSRKDAKTQRKFVVPDQMKRGLDTQSLAASNNRENTGFPGAAGANSYYLDIKRKKK